MELKFFSPFTDPIDTAIKNFIHHPSITIKKDFAFDNPFEFSKLSSEDTLIEILKKRLVVIYLLRS